MAFKREFILVDDMGVLRPIIKEYGVAESKFQWREWVIDRENNNFLVKMLGDGYIDKGDPGIFVLGWNSNIIRIEAIYDVAGRAIDGCGAYWQITKIIIQKQIQSEKDTILSNIYSAFYAYGIGFDAMIDEFELKFGCEPEFV